MNREELETAEQLMSFFASVREEMSLTSKSSHSCRGKLDATALLPLRQLFERVCKVA